MIVLIKKSFDLNCEFD